MRICLKLNEETFEEELLITLIIFLFWEESTRKKHLTNLLAIHWMWFLDRNVKYILIEFYRIN